MDKLKEVSSKSTISEKLKELTPQDPREGKVSGCIGLVAAKPPDVVRVRVIKFGNNPDAELGFAMKVSIKPAHKFVWVFPKHFLEYGPIEFVTVDRKQSYAIDFNKVSVAPSSIDLACMVDFPEITNFCRSVVLAKELTDDVTLNITVERGNNWFNNPSKSPWKRTAATENVYWSDTKDGDCGLGVYAGGCVVGQHVGTKGADNGNLFIVFTEKIKGFIMDALNQQ